MPDRLAWIDDEIKELRKANLFRNMPTRQSPPVAGMVQIDGGQFINFGSNDYLGIAASQELVVAVQNAVGQLGFGAGASPLVNGRGTIHRKLEEQLAQFERAQAALIFPTGYAANVGTIASLVGSGDIVFSDQLNHASIIDGCRLSGATVCVYPHSDMEFLNAKLSDARQFRRKLIVTDGLFSMDGDFARLDQLSELAKRHESMMMVDEAHATGVFGEFGRGSCEYFGVEDHVDVKVGTFSKSMGCVGGFVAGKRSLIDWLFNKARPQVFFDGAARSLRRRRH